MEVMPKDSKYALLGVWQGSVGVVQWNDNELDAWREARRINSLGGKVKVVPTVDGQLTEKYQKEKAELFEAKYSKLGV